MASLKNGEQKKSPSLFLVWYISPHFLLQYMFKAENN